jgi:hypothetical protein
LWWFFGGQKKVLGNDSPPVRGLQTIDPAYFCRPDPGSSTPAPESKSLLVLFFRKEQNLLFLKKKKQKDF